MVIANNFLKEGFVLYANQFGEQITKLHFSQPFINPIVKPIDTLPVRGISKLVIPEMPV